MTVLFSSLQIFLTVTSNIFESNSKNLSVRKEGGGGCQLKMGVTRGSGVNKSLKKYKFKIFVFNF